MKTIKAVHFNGINSIHFNALNYCKFPDGITNIRDFIEYFNQNYNSFIELEVFVEKGCVAPYFTDKSIEKQYWNPSLIRMITECEVHILTENEYLDKLRAVISEKCVHCAHYSEDTCEIYFASHRERINLDGECYGFEKAQQ